MIQQALNGVKVLDLTHYIAGPYCTKLLADYGADVMKLERPGSGDGARRLGPFPKDEPDPEKSALFLHLNTNKRGFTLNLKSPEGAEIFKKLVQQVDVVVESFEPRVMPSLGLSYDVLSALNPSLVMVSVSDFGQTGPYRDYHGSEIVDYAIGGAYITAGMADRNPIKLGGSAVQYLAGVHAAGAASVAITAQTFSGFGDHVDISIMQTQAGSPDRRVIMNIGYQYTGAVNERGTWSSSPPVRPCIDGYINIAIGLGWWDRIAEMLGRPDLKDDPRFTDFVEASKEENAAEMEAIFMEWLLPQTMREAWAEAQSYRVLSGPIYTIGDAFNDDNVRERGFWESIHHPDAGALEYTGLPFSTFEAPRTKRSPAPRLGQHTGEILATVGYEEKDLARLMDRGVI